MDLGDDLPGPGLVNSSISERSSAFAQAAEKLRARGVVRRNFVPKASGRAEAADKRLRGRAVVYRQDVQVSRSLAVKRRGAGTRGEITELSDKSKRRLSLVARNIDGLTHLITLTYPGDFQAVVPDGRVLKWHMAKLRYRLCRRGIGGLWFVEFQDRGAPHVHILVNGAVGRGELSAWWYEIVGSGDERHLRAGTQIARLRLEDGAARYASKYASKFEQKLIPVAFEGIGRMWGLFGGVKPHRFEIEGVLSGEIAAVHRVVRRLQRARSRERLGKPPGARARRRDQKYQSGRAWASMFVDKGVHGWTSYGVGPAVELYVRWRRSLSSGLH
jgi:hypothetical protein